MPFQIHHKFRDKEVSVIEIVRTIYVLASSSITFGDFLVDWLFTMDFYPSREDHDLLMKK